MQELDIQPTETELRGAWSLVDGVAQADEHCRRIEWLTHTRLQELARAEEGWSTLYRDPGDGRLWELTYPQSEMHGGGPPRLAVVSEAEARQKYGDDVV